MIKQMVGVRRKPGITHQECCDYVEHVHGDLARKSTNGVLKYVQSHAFDAAFGAQTDKGYEQTFGRDFVTELYFASPDAMKQNFADPYTTDVIRPDGRNFNDFASVILAVVNETELPVPNPGAGSIKVMHYLKKADDVTDANFYQHWTDAHHRILAEQPTVASALRQYAQSRPLAGPGDNKAHFGAGEAVTYEGIASLWFDDVAALKAFRTYEAELGKHAFVNLSKSFFLYTTEKIIFATD